MKKEIIATLLMECVLLCVIAGSLSAALLSSLYIEFNLLRIMLLTALVCIVLRFVLKNKKTTLVFIPFALFLTTAIGYLMNPNNFFTSIINYFSWLTNFAANNVGLNHSYARATVAIVTILTGAIFHVLNIKLRLFAIPFILGVAFLFTLWYIGHEQITLYIWLFALGSIISWGASYHRTLSKKFKLPNRGLWQACVLPIAILIVLTATIITPGPNSRNLQWGYLVDTIDKIDDTFFGYKGSRKPFRLSSTGFPSSSTSLGGPVKANEELALLVQSPVPLLLRGSVLNEYTGTTWIGSVPDMRYKYSERSTKEATDTAYDHDESIWSNIDPTSQDEPFYLPVEITISHVGIDASVLFHAYSLMDIDMHKTKAVPYHNTSSELFANKVLRDDESYIVVSTVPNLMGNTDFINYLRTASPTLDWRQRIDRYSSDESYNKKLQHIYDNYMAVPDTVPERVEKLTLLITEGKETAYDKIATIWGYLNNENYGYTLSPRNTPDGQDFVDYFLFDLKEGYCTYFASAMAVMGRIAGIPTRYIEGFSMPSESGNDGVYEVRNINGHAWVEVYFPEVGWIPVDPTPGSRPGSIPASQEIPPTDRYWEQYYRQYYEQMRHEEQRKPQSPGRNLALSKEFLRETLQITSIVLALVVIVVALIVLIAYALRQRRFRRLPYNNQLYFYYDEILWLLKLYGKPIEKGETPYAYASRIDKWLVNPEGSIKDISRLLIESEFGHRELTRDDIEFTKEFYKNVRTSMKEVLGYPKYAFKAVARRLAPTRNTTY